MAERKSWAVSASPGGEITTLDGRHAIGAGWFPGAAVMAKRVGRIPNNTTPLNVTATTPTPNGFVHVSAGHMIWPGTRTTSAYVQTSDSIKSINILSTPAHGSLTRWDLIIGRQNDTAHADGDNTWTISQLVGTPAASPADPALPHTDCSVLARVVVGPAASSISQANITQLLTNYTVPIGGVLPCATAAVRDALTPYEGMTTWQMDTDWPLVYNGSAWRLLTNIAVGVFGDLSSVPSPFNGQLVVCQADNILYRYNGSVWVSAAALAGTTAATTHEAKYYASVAQSIPNATDRRILFPNSEYTTSDITTATVSSGTEFTFARAGLVSIKASSRLLGSGGSAQKYLGLVKSTDFNTRYAEIDRETASGVPLNVSTDLRVAIGDKVCAIHYQDSGGALNTDATYGRNVSISFIWHRG